MAITAHVYQIYIAATPAEVWRAITESDWTRRYFHAVSFAEPPRPGGRYLTVVPDGSPAVEGVVEECTAPDGDRPGRFVHTWRVRYDEELAAEPPSRVEWTIAAAGDGLTRVRLVHGDLANSPLTWQNVRTGWVWVLGSLKSVLESGHGLPRRTDHAADAAVDGDSSDGQWHRRQAVEANNSAWELLDRSRLSEAEQEELLRRVYAAAYHWQRAAGRQPANEARACYLIAKGLLACGRPDAALAAAERCLEVCRENDLADFDLAYAHEARARSLLATGRQQEAAAAWAAATAVTIMDPDDRELVERDFADYPG